VRALCGLQLFRRVWYTVHHTHQHTDPAKHACVVGVLHRLLSGRGQTSWALWKPWFVTEGKCVMRRRVVFLVMYIPQLC